MRILLSLLVLFAVAAPVRAEPVMIDYTAARECRPRYMVGPDQAQPQPQGAAARVRGADDENGNRKSDITTSSISYDAQDRLEQYWSTTYG